MLNDIAENRRIAQLAGRFRRPPHRLNGIHESDAEIVDLGGGAGVRLAITTDALIEEIASGLYDDPHFIGWMLAMVNFSDLAAVGADPLGLMTAVTYGPGQDDAFLDALASGISDACDRLGTYVLGGDTNRGGSLILCGTAVGTVSKSDPISRIGAKPGDRIYLTRPAGLGNIYAFLKLTGKGAAIPPGLYTPVARMTEGKIIRRHASCAMDTSDGVVHTLDTLMRLNGGRFILDAGLEEAVHPFAAAVCRAQRLPAWLVLAAVHGEFELCFTVAAAREEAFLREAGVSGWAPVRIGEVEAGTGVAVRLEDRLIPVDSAAIRNLSDEAGDDPARYIRRLLEISAAAGLSEFPKEEFS